MLRVLFYFIIFKIIFPSWWQVLLEEVRRDNDGAEEAFCKAIEINPKDAIALADFAQFLCAARLREARGDRERSSVLARAEEMYLRALTIDPQNATYLYNFANMLKRDAKDFERAEEYYTKCLAVDPKHSEALGNLANLLTDVKRDFDRAEEPVVFLQSTVLAMGRPVFHSHGLDFHSAHCFARIFIPAHCFAFSMTGCTPAASPQSPTTRPTLAILLIFCGTCATTRAAPKRCIPAPRRAKASLRTC